VVIWRWRSAVYLTQTAGEKNGARHSLPMAH